MLMELNENNFNVFTHNSSCVMFCADWCIPCKATLKVLDRISEDNKDIDFGVIDIEKYPKMQEIYHIYSLPTLLFFDKNQPITMLVGSVREESILDKLDEVRYECC